MNVGKASILLVMAGTMVTLAGCGQDATPAPRPAQSATPAATGAPAMMASATPSPAPSASPSPLPSPESTPVPPASAPSASATPAPAFPPCAEVPRRGRYFPDKPVMIPGALHALVIGGTTRLSVKTLSGRTLCVNMYGMAQARDFRISEDLRLLGFWWTGYEADGYKVIDRIGHGRVIETVSRPLLSPGHKRFAAIQFSDASFGGIEGVRVWEVGKRQVVRVADVSNKGGLYGNSWRLLRWADDSCLVLSMMPFDRDVGPRRRMELRLLKNDFAFTEIEPGHAGCAPPEEEGEARPGKTGVHKPAGKSRTGHGRTRHGRA